jgi:hypothetical protein
MLRKTILSLTLPLMLSLTSPMQAADDSVTTVPYEGAAETDVARKGGLAPLRAISAAASEDTRGVDCFYEQNANLPDCAGGPSEQAEVGTPGPFRQAQDE